MVIIKQPARPPAPLLRSRQANCCTCGRVLKPGVYVAVSPRVQYNLHSRRGLSMAPHYTCQRCYAIQNM